MASRLLVVLPQDDHVGVSQKIALALRDELRKRLQLLTRTEGGGIILRTNGEDASDGELADDIAYLRKTWAGIRQAAQRSLPATLLHQDLSLIQRVLRDLTGEATQSIQVDSREHFDLLTAFGRAFMPSAVGKLQHYKGERPIFDLYGADEEIARALDRRVDLKSGGYLIVDQTEALTTMDVNTGGYVGARNFYDTIFKTNLEAARRPLHASCACATSVALSSSTSSTWCAKITATRCWRSSASNSRATGSRPWPVGSRNSGWSR